MLVDAESDLLFAATQRCVLKDMRYTSGIRWVCLESNAEDIVLVVSRNVKVVCACSIVLQMNRCEMKLRDMLFLLNRESVQTVSLGRITLELRDRRCRPSEAWETTCGLESIPQLWMAERSEAPMLQSFAGEQHVCDTRGP